MIGGIQGLRALAALLVVVQHVIVYACLHTGADFLPFLPVPFGSLGVNVFFVISGYVMALCVPEGRRFLGRRAVRIYPTYWLAIAVSAIVMPLAGRAWTIDPVSVLLIPSTTLNQSYTIPYWTLVYEVVFYAVFGVAVLVGLRARGLTVLLGSWAGVVIVSSVLGITPPEESIIAAPGAWIMLSPPTLLFICGALAGLLARDALARTSAGALAIGVVTLFAVTQLSAWSLVADYLILGPAVVCAIELARRWTPPQWIVTLGDASYGLYLAHVMGIIIALTALEAMAPTARLAVVAATAAAGALVVGVAFGLLDRHVYRRYLRRLITLPPSKDETAELSVR